MTVLYMCLLSIKPSGGLQSASYIQISFQSIPTSSSRMKTLKLTTLMLKDRYISIIKKEGLEISQPVLDPEKSELHHPIKARDKKSTVHRFSIFLRKLFSGGMRKDLVS